MSTILIVDDSASFRRQLRADLEAARHRVVEAENGREGVATYHGKGPFDLVICDLNMPIMDGLELAAQLSADKGAARPPIFMLSSERSEAAKRQGQANGVIAWVVKPYIKDKLLAAVAKVTAATAGA